MSNKTFYVELSLNSVFVTDENKKEELLKKIKEAIESMISDEKVVHFSESLNAISEEQIYSEYALGISSDFN